MSTSGLIPTTNTYPSVYSSSIQPGIIGSYPMTSINYSNPGQYYGNMQQQQQPFPTMSQSVFGTNGTLAPPPPYTNLNNNYSSFNNKF